MGGGFAYYRPDGALIKDRAERKRINSLAIPPAWTDVWICPDPGGHMQVTARDAKGRKQYRYGLTTLRQRHAEVEGHTVRFEFKGKSGVPHSVTITDRRLAAIVQQLQDLPGQQLFQFIDEDGKRQSIDSDDVNAYLREVTGLNVTAKDFRTWSGTMLAARALREMGPGAGEREVRRNINRALEQVASRLRNTRTVCRKYYVHPAILDAYQRGVTAPAPPQPPAERKFRPSAALRREEITVLQFLQQEIAKR